MITHLEPTLRDIVRVERYRPGDAIVAFTAGGDRIAAFETDWRLNSIFYEGCDDPVLELARTLLAPDPRAVPNEVGLYPTDTVVSVAVLASLDPSDECPEQIGQNRRRSWARSSRSSLCREVDVMLMANLLAKARIYAQQPMPFRIARILCSEELFDSNLVRSLTQGIAWWEKAVPAAAAIAGRSA